jgi:hypothetical protein
VLPADPQALAHKAQHLPNAANAFKQKRLNIWVGSLTPWLSRFTAGSRQVVAGTCITTDNGTVVPGSYISVAPGTQIQLLKSGAASWTLSMNNTRVQGTAIFEVT